MKGSGNTTYYVLSDLSLVEKNEQPEEGTPHISSLNEGLTPHISSLNEGLTPHISSLNEGLTPHTSSLKGGFPLLSEGLEGEIQFLGKRSSPTKNKELIKALCSTQALQLSELSKIFGRTPRYLQEKYLSGMIETGELVYLYPDQPAHPKQAYKTPDISS